MRTGILSFSIVLYSNVMMEVIKINLVPNKQELVKHDMQILFWSCLKLFHIYKLRF